MTSYSYSFYNPLIQFKIYSHFMNSDEIKGKEQFIVFEYTLHQFKQ